MVTREPCGVVLLPPTKTRLVVPAFGEAALSFAACVAVCFPLRCARAAGPTSVTERTVSAKAARSAVAHRRRAWLLNFELIFRGIAVVFVLLKEKARAGRSASALCNSGVSLVIHQFAAGRPSPGH